jgi:hypothetical protein
MKRQYFVSIDIILIFRIHLYAPYLIDKYRIPKESPTRQNWSNTHWYDTAKLGKIKSKIISKELYLLVYNNVSY